MAETDVTGKIHEDTDSVENLNAVRRTATATAGTNTDTWAVPSGQSAELKGVRVFNPDASARNIKVEILDNNSNVVGALSNTGVDVVSVPAASALVITPPYEFLLAAGWQLKVTWAGMTASGALDWEVIYEDEQS